jgi:hypothetical protein
MKRISIIFLTLLLTGIYSMQAQPTAHEFSVSAAGGFAANCYQPLSKDISSVGFSSDFGVGFTGFVSQQLGFQIGAGFGLFNVKSKANNLSSVVIGKLKDDNGENIDLHTKLLGVTELHKTFFLHIPAMIQFQTKMKPAWDWTRSQKSGFYALAGVKVLFLVSNRYESFVAELHNAAYYPDLDNWAATQKFAGFGGFNEGYRAVGKLEFGVMALFTVEAGMKWRISKTAYLYTGVYYDCGLNDPTKNSRKSYSQYKSEKDLEELSILKLADKLNYMAGGIKIRVAFTSFQ